MSDTLTIQDHRRDAVGMTYVYPVISRRAGGVSVGINLNPNNACNWRCVYCQVPDLARGGPPPLDMAQLERELRTMLDDILHGQFMQERVALDMRHLSDVAFSGNGEPTSAREFPLAVALAARVLRELGLAGQVKLRLITNGSLLDRPSVRQGIAALGQTGGEVWFKLDAATPGAIQRINGSRQNPAAMLRRLQQCAQLCATWVQSCVFALDGSPPGADEIEAYLGMIAAAGDNLAGVHLYGLARPSCQPEAARLTRLPATWLEALAERLRAQGLRVDVSP